MQCISLEGPTRCVLIWVRHADALCLIFSFPTYSELHYYLMRSFHSWQPLELEGFMHRMGPLTMVKIQSWGVFSLLFAGRVTSYNTTHLSFPTLNGGRSCRGERLAFAVGMCLWDLMGCVVDGRVQVGRIVLNTSFVSSFAERSGSRSPFQHMLGWLSYSSSPAFSPHLPLQPQPVPLAQLRLSRLFLFSTHLHMCIT